MTHEINNDNKPGSSDMTDSDTFDVKADTLIGAGAVSYTHLTLPTNREV